MYPYSLIQDKVFVKPQADAVQRVVVIDGCNVARSSCGVSRENVNCAGLMATIRFLLVRDVDAVAFLPVVYNNLFNFNVRNAEVLEKLQDFGVLTFTPARSARGDRPALVNYDDLYVLEFAERHGGSVLSGDRFEDIAFDVTYAKYHRIIRYKIDVRYRSLTHDYVQYGRDRFYKCLPQFWTSQLIECEGGKSLDERLRGRFFCLPSDPDFQKVSNHRAKWNAERRDAIISAIDEMLDAMAARDGTTTTVIPVCHETASGAVNGESSRKPDSTAARPSKELGAAASNKAAEKTVSRVVSDRGMLNYCMDGEELARRWFSPSVDDGKPDEDAGEDPADLSATACASRRSSNITRLATLADKYKVVCHSERWTFSNTQKRRAEKVVVGECLSSRDADAAAGTSGSGGADATDCWTPSGTARADSPTSPDELSSLQLQDNAAQTRVDALMGSGFDADATTGPKDEGAEACDDALTLNILRKLSPIFGADLVRRVLREKPAVRSMFMIANICAELSGFS